MEKSQVVLKRRAKRMKAMEKRLEGIENCQNYLKKKGRKQKAMEERIDGIEKEMKRKENENTDGFNYQNMDMDFDWVEEEVQKEGEGEVQKEAELNEGKEVEEEPEQTEKVEKEAMIYTEEEKKGWILTKRGRPRKADKPQKFTTPPPTKRTRAPSQYVTTPFTEANTDKIEGRKKKPRTKA
ncbi:hypothetical protein Bca101_067688 [Brassica carinata]